MMKVSEQIKEVPHTYITRNGDYVRGFKLSKDNFSYLEEFGVDEWSLDNSKAILYPDTLRLSFPYGYWMIQKVYPDFEIVSSKFMHEATLVG